MKLKYFGTDGVRGVANQDLSPELAFRSWSRRWICPYSALRTETTSSISCS